MEHVNKMYARIRTGLKAIIETVWTIGTSIASAGMLKNNKQKLIWQYIEQIINLNI